MSCSFAIVEDCAEERELYVEYLTSACRLRCVGAYPDAEQALREIPSTRPDVVLMDLRLPGMSGIDCAQHLKRVLPNVKILMITGVTSLDSAKESAEKGAAGYVTKPFSMKELREAIRYVLPAECQCRGAFGNSLGSRPPTAVRQIPLSCLA